MSKRPNFKDSLKKAMLDKEFREEYEALRPEFELMSEFIKARKKAKLSQLQLAEKLNMQQPAIARLESGQYSKSSFDKLSKYAKALGYRLKISLVPRSTKKKAS